MSPHQLLDEWRKAVAGLVACLLWTGTVWAARAAQAETYLITDLGTLGGPSSEARSINEQGLIAGFADNEAGPYHAVVFTNNLWGDLGTLGGSNSVALDISLAGQLAGWSNPSGSSAQRAVQFSNGLLTDLGALLPGSTNSIAFGINQLGTVVGEFQTANGRRRPFVYANGMIPLEFEGAATCVNDNGQIGGYELRSGARLGFIISGVQRQYVGSLGSNDTAVARISTNGVAVGRSRHRSGYLHGFAFQDGVIHDLGTLGGNTSEAFGVNSGGHIVGSAQDKQQGTRAFLFRSGQMFDLNNFLLPESGWVLEVAYGINDSGQIVGKGQFDGQTHGFLLTPNFLEMALYPGLTIRGRVGRSYRIEYLDAFLSTNNWQFLTNLYLPASPYFYVDPRPVLYSNRIYRSVLLPEAPR